MFWVGFILGFSACLAWTILAVAAGLHIGPRLKRRR